MTEPRSTRAEAVTFFEDRAQVTRRAIVPVTRGRVDLSLAGLSVLVDDTSLLARVVGGGARVLTSRVHRVVRSTPAANPDELSRLEAAARDARADEARARRALERSDQAARRLDDLEEQLVKAMRAAHADVAPTGWKTSLDRVRQGVEELVERRMQERRALEEAHRVHARAQRRLNDARVESPEVRANVELQLEVEHDGDVEIELQYYVPCALWRPSHVARLSPARDSLELRLLATVWQRTGEDWSDVACRFSTARPTQAAEAPLLSDDWLFARPKTDVERRIVDVEARDVDIASTGTESRGTVDQMPGVDDGGEPLTFTATERVAIPSTGEPFRVEYARREVACDVSLVAIGERATVPFLRATGTWEHEIPVLAGPVVIMRGNEYAGRSRIDFVAPGETFELGFGAEGAISVHRTVDDEHKTTRVTGKNVLHREVNVNVSNLSDRSVFLNVIERVPVSELEEVTVRKVRSEVPPDDDGFIEFAVELEPREVKTLEVSYRVEYGSKVRLSW